MAEASLEGTESQETAGRDAGAAREQAASLADEASFDAAAGRYVVAGEKYARAAELVAFDAEAQSLFLLRRARVLLANGEPLEALSLYREVAQLRPRSQSGRFWAVLQTDIGALLTKLGEREASTERCEEAIAAFKDALEVSTYDKSPEDWARACGGLGWPLALLGTKEEGTASVEEALS